MQITGSLLSEMELAGQLNRAVLETRTADFSILLSLMSQNVCDHAQFHLPKESRDISVQDEAGLKKALGVRSQYKLAADTCAYASANLQSKSIGDADFCNTHLLNSLHQPALSQFNDPDRIADDVIDNTSLYTQYKLHADRQQYTPEADATVLLDILNQLPQ